jgi:serine/threonine-protein kinase HipA
MKQANVYMYSRLAGVLSENTNGYTFRYEPVYLQDKDAQAISLTMPLREQPYQDKILFPFFDGLIPEGWLLDIAERSWKINNRDRMSLLLTCCKDCIGAVSIISIENENVDE